jgi:hypothetical protein
MHEFIARKGLISSGSIVAQTSVTSSQGYLGPLYDTASFAVSSSMAISASYISASGIDGTVISASHANVVDYFSYNGTVEIGSSNSTGYVPNAVIIGNQAGQNCTSASSAVLIGVNAGQNTPTASNAVLIGNQAGFKGTNATNAVLIGLSAASASLSNNSVCIGNAAAKTSTTCSNAVIIGSTAGGTTYITDISNAVLIGSGASGSVNSIAIGSNVTASTNETVIGNTSTTSTFIRGPITASFISAQISSSNVYGIIDSTLSGSWASASIVSQTAVVATSASFASQSIIAQTAVVATSASFASASISSSYAATVTSASFATTASFARTVGTLDSLTVTGDINATNGTGNFDAIEANSADISGPLTASYIKATLLGTASYANQALSDSYAPFTQTVQTTVASASWVSASANITIANSASYYSGSVTSASYAATASLAPQPVFGTDFIVDSGSVATTIFNPYPFTVIADPTDYGNGDSIYPVGTQFTHSFYRMITGSNSYFGPSENVTMHTQSAPRMPFMSTASILSNESIFWRMTARSASTVISQSYAIVPNGFGCFSGNIRLAFIADSTIGDQIHTFELPWNFSTITTFSPYTGSAVTTYPLTQTNNQFVVGVYTASYANLALSTSYYGGSVTSASYTNTASYALTASYSNTASYVPTSSFTISSSFVSGSIQFVGVQDFYVPKWTNGILSPTSSIVDSGSAGVTMSVNLKISNVFGSASYATTASYALNGGGSSTSASWASASISASYATTASAAYVFTAYFVSASNGMLVGPGTDDSLVTMYVSASNSTGNIAEFDDYMGNEALVIGYNCVSAFSGSTQYPFQFFNNLNNESELFNMNVRAGTSASTDVVCWNDTANSKSYQGVGYVDLGINSTQYAYGFVGAQGDSYLYATSSQSSSFCIGNIDLTGSVLLFAGSFANTGSGLILKSGSFQSNVPFTCSNIQGTCSVATVGVVTTASYASGSIQFVNVTNGQIPVWTANTLSLTSSLSQGASGITASAGISASVLGPSSAKSWINFTQKGTSITTNTSYGQYSTPSVTRLAGGLYLYSFGTVGLPSAFYCVEIAAVTSSTLGSAPTASIGCVYGQTITGFTCSFCTITSPVVPADPGSGSIVVFSY